MNYLRTSIHVIVLFSTLQACNQPCITSLLQDKLNPSPSGYVISFTASEAGSHVLHSADISASATAVKVSDSLQ